MDERYKQTCLNGILALGLISSVAFADTAQITPADTAQTAPMDPVAEMARADKFYNEEQMVDAAELYKKLALQNYAPAQAVLGDLLDYSEIHDVAVGWYIMAASQGNEAGAYGLGRAYLNGLGIKKEPAQALFWFNYSAEKDFLNAVKVMEAAYKIGADSGLPIAVDLKKSEFWKAKRIPMEEAKKKSDDAKKQAILKDRFEKQEARKKADAEAAAAAAK